jgi:hypothetical protein
MAMAGHLRDDGPPPPAARQDDAVESDDDEGQIRLSYTLNLHLMQLPGTFLRRTKCLGRVTFEAMELFEDEDSENRHIPNALGMLNTNALNLVLTRIQRKVGFVCSGFEYTGNPGTKRGDPSGSSKIMVSTWSELDKCLEYIEDNSNHGNKGLDVAVVPICSFLFQDEGDDAKEDFRIDTSALGITWGWMSTEIQV